MMVVSLNVTNEFPLLPRNRCLCLVAVSRGASNSGGVTCGCSAAPSLSRLSLRSSREALSYSPLCSNRLGCHCSCLFIPTVMAHCLSVRKPAKISSKLTRFRPFTATFSPRQNPNHFHQQSPSISRGKYWPEGSEDSHRCESFGVPVLRLINFLLKP